MKKGLWKTMVTLAMSATMLFSATLAFAKTEQTTEDSIAVTAEADENGFVIEDGVLVGYEGTAEEVVIPDGVTSIGEYAFRKRTSLTEVTIPGSVTSIGDHAFYGCSSLTEVTIPEGITSIGMFTFMKCSSLTEVTIPSSVTSIKDGAFCYCTNLTEINVSSGNNSYVSVDGIVYTKDKTELVMFPGGKTEVDILDSITSIRNDAFYGCTNLTDVTIPGSVTSIGYGAFWECESLKEVTIPGSVMSIGNGTFYGCASLTEVTIPSSVTSIGNGIFYGCANLTAVTIPSSVTSIGYEAFWDCPNLTIYGISGSYAETYAKEYNIPFVALSTADFAIDQESTNSAYTKGSSEGATIKCLWDLADFLNVYVDGTLIDKTNYTLKEGSTIITFTQAFMDSLSAGEHIFTLEYTENRKVEVSMTITGDEAQTSTTGTTTGNSQQQASNAKTGDKGVLFPCLLLCASVLGLGVSIRKYKRA